MTFTLPDIIHSLGGQSLQVKFAKYDDLFLLLSITKLHGDAEQATKAREKLSP